MGARMGRVNEQLRTELAALIDGLTDPRIGMVTVTGVDTDAELAHATVWYTTLPDGPEDLARTAEGLTRATPMLRSELAGRVRLRRMPVLHFRHDPAPGQGRHIESLLAETREADEARREGGADAGQG